MHLPAVVPLVVLGLAAILGIKGKQYVCLWNVAFRGYENSDIRNRAIRRKHNSEAMHQGFLETIHLETETLLPMVLMPIDGIGLPFN